jgi:hypothetical protein
MEFLPQYSVNDGREVPDDERERGLADGWKRGYFAQSDRPNLAATKKVPAE